MNPSMGGSATTVQGSSTLLKQTISIPRLYLQTEFELHDLDREHFGRGGVGVYSMPDLRKPGMADEEPYMDVLVGVSGSDIYPWPDSEQLAN